MLEGRWGNTPTINHTNELTQVDIDMQLCNLLYSGEQMELDQL